MPSAAEEEDEHPSKRTKREKAVLIPIPDVRKFCQDENQPFDTIMFVPTEFTQWVNGGMRFDLAQSDRYHDGRPVSICTQYLNFLFSREDAPDRVDRNDLAMIDLRYGDKTLYFFRAPQVAPQGLRLKHRPPPPPRLFGSMAGAHHRAVCEYLELDFREPPLKVIIERVQSLLRECRSLGTVVLTTGPFAKLSKLREVNFQTRLTEYVTNLVFAGDFSNTFEHQGIQFHGNFFEGLSDYDQETLIYWLAASPNLHIRFQAMRVSNETFRVNPYKDRTHITNLKHFMEEIPPTLGDFFGTVDDASRFYW